MRLLSNWERSDAVRLDIVAELLGLGKSPPGMDGSQVLGLWRAGRVEEIEAYCLGDVRLVYEVFLRIEPYFGVRPRPLPTVAGRQDALDLEP
jgi:predicted PolB exonuclease-like 3'-5' exonuclease